MDNAILSKIKSNSDENPLIKNILSKNRVPYRNSILREMKYKKNNKNMKNISPNKSLVGFKNNEVRIVWKV